jgi:hypothetical protein
MVSYYLPKKKVNSEGQLLPTKEEGKQLTFTVYLLLWQVIAEHHCLPSSLVGNS